MTRILVTGLGIVAPSGIGAEAYWRSTVAGQLCVRPIEAFDASGFRVRLAGQVPDFDVTEYLDARLIVQTDRWTWLSLAAARLALDDAKYDPAAHDPYATSVVLASGSGGNAFGQREIEALWRRGPAAVSAYQSIAWFYAASTGQTSILHGTKGPAGVVVSDGAGGLDCLGAARRIIRRGTPAVLSGGTEAPLSPYGQVCQMDGGRGSTRIDPAEAYKPFDRNANGYVPAEGGAILLLEEAEAAARRGAREVYGEVIGYAATHDAYHFERPAPDHRQLKNAIERALADAGRQASDVDVVFADGAGSPDLDALEAGAIREVFGPSIPVSAPQGFTGRLCSGGGALSVAAALLALREGTVPAVGNLSEPAYDLDFIRTARRLDPEVAVVIARGHGGFNSALVIRAYREDPA